MEFILNDKTIQTNKPGGMTLLDFIRYEKSLTGTKIGCREGDCGACTVLVGEIKEGNLEYQSITSCISPLANAAGKHIVTVEGLNMKELSPVQKAFVDAGGTQCGFCTVGFIVSLTGYCMNPGNATYEDGISSIDGNICRCTGYKSIERATANVVQQLKGKPGKDRWEWLVSTGFIPAYFKDIKERLEGIKNPGLHSNGQNGKAVKSVVGGGTDLYVQRPESLAEGEVSAFLARIDLKGVKTVGNQIRIGGASTVSDLWQSEEFRAQFPEIKRHFKLISSTQIRNMGTVGGNFVNASPIGDLTIFFLALNSSITLKDSAGASRTILLKDFYNGYKTLDKKPDEFIESAQFEKLDKSTRFNFEKVSKRTNLDIASANSALRIKMQGDKIEEVYISAGGVGPIPKFLNKTSTFLQGKQLSPDLISEAADIIQQEISPISDARGAKEYKALLLRQIFFAHFIELFPERFSMEVLS